MSTDTNPATIELALQITRNAIDRTNSNIAATRQALRVQLDSLDQLRGAERQLLDNLHKPDHTWVTMSCRDLIVGDVIRWPGHTSEEHVHHVGRLACQRVELGTDRTLADFDVDGWYPVQVRYPRPVDVSAEDAAREAVQVA